MEVLTIVIQQGQQIFVDLVFILLKGLTNDKLLYIVDHINKNYQRFKIIK